MNKVKTITTLRDNKKAFTLIELITCVTILGIIMALLIPSYIQRIDQTRMRAAQTECAGCVTAAVMDIADGTMDELLADEKDEPADNEAASTISDEPVALAAAPQTAAAQPEATEPLTTQVEAAAATEGFEELAEQAQVDGEVLDLETDGNGISRLVYTTQSGLYTVIYEDGSYSTVKNK